MTETSHTWDIGEDIPFELFVMDPVTGLGLTGQLAFITLTVRRMSDDAFWNGSDWIGTAAQVAVAEPDDVNHPGRYTYTLSGADANTQADIYTFHVLVDNPGLPYQGENYETHKSRRQDVIVVEGEPSQ